MIPDKDKAQELKHAISIADYSLAEKELESKSSIIIEELRQSDLYTKRTRPMLMRWGLYMIGVNHVVFPLIGRICKILSVDLDAETISALPLPAEFWYAWGGICGVYVLGRSMEKAGGMGGLISAMTGNKGK